MSDGRHPHKYPPSLVDGSVDEVLKWRCDACGHWVDEGSSDADDCPIDWRTPNPYAFEVAVRQWTFGRKPWYVHVWPVADDDDDNELSYGPFDTEADANTHADLVLAALKGATRE